MAHEGASKDLREQAGIPGTNRDSRGQAGCFRERAGKLEVQGTSWNPWEWAGTAQCELGPHGAIWDPRERAGTTGSINRLGSHCSTYTCSHSHALLTRIPSNPSLLLRPFAHARSDERIRELEGLRYNDM